MTDVSPQNIRHCKTCGAANELPFIFCAQCGAPRVRLGRWRVTIDLSLILTAFLAHHIYGEVLRWNWPLYTLYALLFTQFTEALAKGRWRLMRRVWGWCLFFFGGLYALIEIMHREGPDTYVFALDLMPQLARDQPLLFWLGVSGVLALIFGPMYVRWGRKYGWVNAYRLVVLSLLAVSLAGWAVIESLHFIQRHELIPTIQAPLQEWSRNSRPQYVRWFHFATLTMIRLFIFEIFVFAAVRGYAEVRRTKVRLPQTRLQGESGFTRSLVRIAHGVQRLVQSIVNMAHYLISTLMVLGSDLAQIGRAFFRELLGPTLALGVAAGLVYQMMRWTDAYIAQNSLDLVIRMMIGVAVLVLCSLLFLGFKTDYRWGRIFDFYGQLMGWLLPNLLVFFLLLSLSLWGSSLALNQLDPEVYHLPFRPGLLTQIVGTLLALMIVVVLIRKRSLLAPHAETDHAPVGVTPPAPLPEPALMEDQREGEVSAAGPSLLRRMSERPTAFTRRLIGRAKLAAEEMGLDEHGGKIMESVRGVTVRMKGKPKVVDELARLKRRVADATAHLEALERTKATIAPATYNTLERQHRRDREEWSRECAALQIEVDRLYAENAVKKAKAEAELERLRAQRAEFEEVHTAGGMEARDFKRRAGQVDMLIETAKLRLEGLQRQEAFLALEATGATPPEED